MATVALKPGLLEGWVDNPPANVSTILLHEEAEMLHLNVIAPGLGSGDLCEKKCRTVLWWWAPSSKFQNEHYVIPVGQIDILARFPGIKWVLRVKEYIFLKIVCKRVDLNNYFWSSFFELVLWPICILLSTYLQILNSHLSFEVVGICLIPASIIFPSSVKLNGLDVLLCYCSHRQKKEGLGNLLEASLGRQV